MVKAGLILLGAAVALGAAAAGYRIAKAVHRTPPPPPPPPSPGLEAEHSTEHLHG